MTISPSQAVKTLLANPVDLANVKNVTTPDVTYVSLNEDNAELKRYLPWTGTNKGPESIVRAFEGITAGAGKDMWITEEAANRIGRIATA